MTGWTVAASPLCTYPTVSAHSVLAATLLHGSFNAVASLSPSVITNDAVFCIDACLVGRVAASCFITFTKSPRENSYLRGHPLAESRIWGKPAFIYLNRL